VFFILFLGLGLAGFSVVLVLRLLLADRAQAVRTLAQIDAYGFKAPGPQQAAPSASVGSRVDALASLLGTFLARRMESFREEELRGHLQAAGLYALSPRKFMGYRVLATLFVPALWLWFSLTGGSGPGRAFLGLCVAVALGWIGPMFLVKRRARSRLDQIDYEIPELIDLLVTTVEAGVGFSGSLQMAARQFKGALGEELRLATQQQEMGLATHEALTNMLERANTPGMRSFVRAILQGETLGVSIGKILRDLALEMRKRRRQMAEERAQKAPTKILFPLILLIFPPMFVILLGPAAIQIVHTLGGGG
jgi:tight adherence protein C